MRVLLYLALTCSVHALQDAHQVKGDPVASIKDPFSVVEDSSKDTKFKATVGGRKTKGVSEGGDVVDASTDSFVARQQLGPKGPHDGKKGVLKTTSGAAKAIDTGASSANGVADELHKTKGVSEGSGGDVVGGVEGVSETVTLSKGTAVDEEFFDVHEAATASTGDEFEKQGTAEFDADQEDVSEKHASFEVVADVDQRRLSTSCGDYVGAPVLECPAERNLANCKNVGPGELCEGDNECGTYGEYNNCGNYEIYWKKHIRRYDGPMETCRYTDRNGCPAGYNIWVPATYDEAKYVREYFGREYTDLVGIFKTTSKCNTGGRDYCKTKMKMNSDWSDALIPNNNPALFWMSVSRTLEENNEGKGSPWFVRKDGYSKEPSGDYKADTWLDAQHHSGYWTNGQGFNFNDNDDSDYYCFTKYLCEACPAGRSKPAGSFGLDNYYCKLCTPGKFAVAGQGECKKCDAGKSSSVEAKSKDACKTCAVGKKSIEGGTCQDCAAGKTSNSARTACETCADGKKSIKGGTCQDCAAGKTSNSAHTGCVNCNAGKYSVKGGVCVGCGAGTISTANQPNKCTLCLAGKTSNSDSYADSQTAYTKCVGCRAGEISSAAGGVCEECPAGTVSNSAHTACVPCGPGTFSVAGQADACTKCGDDATAWKLDNWDQTQSGLTSNNCKCARGFSGYNCDQAECAPTTPVVSLGFLVLEVQWPRYARALSRNEDFVGISAALRAFDADGNNRLSVDEARTALTSGGMDVPLDDLHIWSKGGVELYEDDVTITEMIQDELQRLETQGTKEYYEQPSDVAITAMEATYPNHGPSWNNSICEDQSTKAPLLTWTVDRGGNDFNHTVVNAKPGIHCTIHASSDSPVTKKIAPTELAGTRCCPYDGSKGKSYCDGGSCEPGFVTYDEALAKCTTEGMRLCTPDELLTTGRAYGTGCNFNHAYVWSNDVVPLQPVIFKQCAYFNGEALYQNDGMNPAITDGGLCNAPENDDPSKCTFDFTLEDGNVWPVGEIVVDGLPSNGRQIAEMVPSWADYQMSFNIEFHNDALDVSDATWQGLVLVTNSEGNLGEIERAPAIFLHDKKLKVRQNWREPSFKTDFDSQTKIMSTTEFEAGKSYEITVINEDSRLSLYVDGKLEAFVDAESTYVPDSTQLLVGSPYWPEPRVTLSNGRFARKRPDISKHSYCVETRFCAAGGPCTNTTVDPDLTLTRCTTGLQYDGTPMDIFPRVQGKEGVSISWLDTSTVATGYRVYKYDASVPFAEDTSARLLKEIAVKKADCGLTHDYLDFRDTTTGSEPGLQVGYAIVPLNDAGDELTDKVGVSGYNLALSSSETRRRLTTSSASASSTTSGFIVTWFADIRVKVEAEGGGPVEDVTVKVGHLSNNAIDGNYPMGFVTAQTDEYGEATLEIRVQNRDWNSKTQHFRVTVEKRSEKANGETLVHEFEPPFENVAVRHLSEATFEFTDTTSVVISGTVSHAGFGAAYFADNCPHTKSETTGECMCPVDGAKVFIIRASKDVQEVTLNDGKFSTAVFEGETVTIGLKNYTGGGSSAHSFSVAHNSSNATVQEGTEPTFYYTATEDAEVHFLDTSTQNLSAAVVVGANLAPASYVNGLPIVASVERCGWEIPAWTLQGVADFELGAAEFDVRVLGADEVDDAKYYYPYGDLSNTDQEFVVHDCDGDSGGLTPRDEMVGTVTVDGIVSADERMKRGCRAKVPDVSPSETDRLPCATTKYTYVDELPTTRNFPNVDLSNLANTAASVDFEIISPLCLESVTATGSQLQKLIDPGVDADGNPLTREDAYLIDGSPEGMLLLSELPEPGDDGSLYGKACTTNTGAVFREGDVVNLEFKLVEREPMCPGNGLYPWDICSSYTNVPLPAHDSLPTDRQIKFRVADGVSGIDDSGDYAGDETFNHTMTAGKPNPFAPFSHELSVEFTRAFDGAEILFVRHVLVLGVIPEEVPQVWTVATNPTLIFFVLRDPPGGQSFATLTEGSTISTSMAIDGSHAAELDDSWNLGTSVGAAVDLRAALGLGVEVEKNVLKGGIKVGASYSHTPTDVTVERATSRHFDVGFSFSTGISTSSSPHLPGQPSDIIVGGGANLRFISAIEIFATETGTTSAPNLCLGGLTTKQFLPEQVSTWVMSVYEIEKTIERLGAALTDPNTKITSKDPDEPDPREDLVKQIENWQTVLSNYRAATLRDQAESVADQLSRELDQLQTTFEGFLEEAKDGKDDAFKDFLVDGLNDLGGTGYRGEQVGKIAGVAVVGGPVGLAIGATVAAAVVAGSPTEGPAELRGYDSKNQDRVNRAADECVSAAKLADPSGNHTLCKVYDDIENKMELKESLFGICDFAKPCCEDDSGECSCRERTCADSEEECISDTDCDTGSCELKECSGGEPKCAPVDHFCKRDHYREGQKVIGAFDALHDTTQFITFSGSTGLEFSWDIAEDRGAEITSTHDANMADALGVNVGGGFNIGRRRLESTEKGMPGYAYPVSGRVVAVSKKLLEVTPEALEERRRLNGEWSGGLPTLAEAAAMNDAADSEKLDAIKEAVTKPESASNPCRRRLEGLELSDDERRRLGVTMCGQFGGSFSSSFAVSLGRAAGKDAGHTRQVSVFLGDGNTQDVFAVKISQDAVYGTPIFTTMGGRSSCVGETGTTRRDSRVTIKEIKHLCIADKDRRRASEENTTVCENALSCECKDLPPGEDAIFSVVLENLSPWVAPVRPILRAVKGAVTAWDSGKYGQGVPEICPAGDPGSLEIRAVGNEFDDLRNRLGLIVAPLPYGQFEVRVRVSRYTTAPQCYSFQDIELELVAECEDTDSDDVQEVYQYQTKMNPDNGAVSVVHPKFVGRPVCGPPNDCPEITLVDVCADEASEDTPCDAAGIVDVGANTGTDPDSTYQGDGRWCYSELNLAVDSTTSPEQCWDECDTKITALNSIEGEKSMKEAEANGCPISFIQQTDDKGEEFKCAPGNEAFELKAIDWEEITGQCRCQNSCDCLVEDLYTYDVTKPEDDPDYMTRQTTTHLLTADGLELPKDEYGENVTCGLYTFKDDTVARGSSTHKASFSVSWSSEVHGCMYEDATNYNPLATVDDLSCVFDVAGCPYAAAANYNEEATKDDGSCVFGKEASESCTIAAAAERLFQKPGCTYPGANNYDEDATFDDASCEFSCDGERRRLQEVQLEDGRKCIKSCDGSTICADVAKGDICIVGLSEAGDEVRAVCKQAIATLFDVDESSVTLDDVIPGCIPPTGRRLSGSDRFTLPFAVSDIEAGPNAQFDLDGFNSVFQNAGGSSLGASIDTVGAISWSRDMTAAPTCIECTHSTGCDPGKVCEFGDGGGRRRLRFGNIQYGCCRTART